MPENPVVGMVGFLLGHGLNNGVGQRRKTSSIEGTVPFDIARSGELRFDGTLTSPESATKIVWGDWGQFGGILLVLWSLLAN
jgi:hypothetical protein